MLTIRLSRVGKKNMPLYRVIISEKQKDLYGSSLEILGSYNPHTKELKIDAEKTKYWLSKGAGMSDTVNNLLVEKKIIEGKKLKASKSRTPKKAPAPAAPAKATAEPTPKEAAPAATPAAEPKTEQPAT